MADIGGHLQRIEKRIDGNEERSNQNTAGVQRNSEKINKLAELQASITDKIDSQTTETWNAIDKVVTSHNESVTGINELIKINKTNIENVQFNIVQEVEALKDQNKKIMETFHGRLEDTSSKVTQLEEAHQLQVQKNGHYDSLKSQIVKLDEERQRQEAKTRDEVDATLNQNNLIINRLNDLEGKTEVNTKSLTEIEPLAKSTDQKIAVIKQEIIKETNSHFESIKSEVSTTLLKVVEKKDDFEKYFESMKEESQKDKKKLLTFVEEKIDNEVKRIEDSQLNLEKQFDTSTSLLSTVSNKVVTLEDGEKNQKITINKLENILEDSNAKIESLEAADIFLQGTYRKMTEKSIEIEKDMKTLESKITKENDQMKIEILDQIQSDRTKAEHENEDFLRNIGELNGKFSGICLICFFKKIRYGNMNSKIQTYSAICSMQIMFCYLNPRAK